MALLRPSRRGRSFCCYGANKVRSVRSVAGSLVFGCLRKCAQWAGHSLMAGGAFALILRSNQFLRWSRCRRCEASRSWITVAANLWTLQLHWTTIGLPVISEHYVAFCDRYGSYLWEVEQYSLPTSSGRMTANSEVGPKTSSFRLGHNPTGTQRTDDIGLGERIGLESTVELFADF